MEEYEIIIIGGGPAGLTAGLYARRAHLETILLEATVPSGQTSMAGSIENYPGFPAGISGQELIALFAQQAKRFDLEIRQYTRAEKIEMANGKKIVMSGDNKFSASALIIASGAKYNRLGIPGEEKFANKGVSYCATCDGTLFEDLHVAVIGGGDTAIEEALYLSNIAAEVVVIHRRDRLRAQKTLQERAFHNPKIKFVWNRVPKEIKGGELVETLILENVKEPMEEELPVSAVFIAVGQRPNADYIQGLAEVDDAGYIITDHNCSTSVPGVFAAGDVRKKTLRQISTAVGDGAVAAFEAERYIEAQKVEYVTLRGECRRGECHRVVDFANSVEPV
jgi:thioredoxin reductase (NADPH)